MKLLPPKPPMAAGTAKVVKKKSNKEESPIETSLPNDGVETTNSGMEQRLDIPEQAATIDEPVPIETPEILSAEEHNVDATLASMVSGQDSAKEKKKGLFSRLFGKKENAANDVIKQENIQVNPVQTSDTTNINTNINSEEQSLDTYVEETLPGKTAESIPDELEDATLDNTYQGTALKTNENSDEESWDKNEDIPSFVNTAKSYSPVYAEKKNYEKKYSSAKFSNKTDYVNYDSFSSYKKSDSPPNLSMDSANDADSSEESWDIDLNQAETSSLPAKVTMKKDKSDKSEKSQAAGKKSEKKSDKQSAKKEEETQLRQQDGEKEIIPKVKNSADFTAPINDWREKAISTATTTKTDAKTIKQIDIKLRKLLKIQEAKLSKMAVTAKKTISAEAEKVNKNIAEMQKKEKIILAKEQKLLHLEKSLVKERTEFDDLVNTEKELMKSKDILESDILRYTKEITDMKQELSKVKKEFASDKKAISAEKIRLQSEFKNIKVIIENERRRGEKKLSELAKQVEEAQALLEETNKRNREMTAKLRNKELLLEQREKEVTELIEQEQKIVAVLKSNENPSFMQPVHQRKKRAPKPATMLNVDGEPELYADDEDNLLKKMDDCKELLSEKNYEDAKLLYNELREEFLKTDLDAKRKAELGHEIREIYDEICLSLVSPKK